MNQVPQPPQQPPLWAVHASKRLLLFFDPATPGQAQAFSLDLMENAGINVKGIERVLPCVDQRIQVAGGANVAQELERLRRMGKRR